MSNPFIPRQFLFSRLRRQDLPPFLCLGRSCCLRERFFLLEDHDRAAHTYICGITGSGKTRFLENLLIQDIALGNPVALVDPTGSLYTKMLDFIAHCLEQAATEFSVAELDIIMRRYLFLNTDDPENPLRINPLEPFGTESTEEMVDDLMKVVERLFGSIDEMRRLRQILRSTFWVIAELNALPEKNRPALPEGFSYPVPLRFAAQFLLLNKDRRQVYLSALPGDRKNAYILQFWEEFYTQYTDYQRQERIESTWNILQYFLGDTLVAEFFGVERSTIRVGELLRTGTSLFCYVPLGKNLKGAQLIGTYLATKFQRSAYRRSPLDRLKPYGLYLEEFPEFADEEFARAFATLRQYGLRVTVAHQSMDQPPFHTPEGRALLHTIRANALVKVLFRLSRKDAEEMAPEFFELTQRKSHFRYVERSTLSQESSGRVETVSFQKTSARGKSWSRSNATTLAKTSSFAVQESLGTNIGKQLMEGFGKNQASSLAQSITVAEAEGITEVWSQQQGMSIAFGEGWSQMRDYHRGFTFTENVTQSLAELHGQDITTTRSQQTGHTTNTGRNFTVTSTAGDRLTYNQSKGATFHSHKQSSESTSSGTNIGKLRQVADANGQSYSEAIQEMRTVAEGLSQKCSVSGTQAMGTSATKSSQSGFQEGQTSSSTKTSREEFGQQVGSSSSKTRSEGVTTTNMSQDSWQQQLSHSFAQLVQFSESFTESLQESVQEVLTHQDSQTESTATGESVALQNAVQHGESVTERVVFYSLEGERELTVNSLQRLATGHCVVSKIALGAQEIETIHIPDGYFSYYDRNRPMEILTAQRDRFGQQVKKELLQEVQDALPFALGAKKEPEDPFEF